MLSTCDEYKMTVNDSAQSLNDQKPHIFQAGLELDLA